jgi:predicted nucleotidyltransferase
MRLTDFEIESIKNVAKHHFGSEIEVFLFGSRTSEKLRGGDIDLFIRSSQGKDLKSGSKVSFITDLVMLIGEQKIDVVLGNRETLSSGLVKTIYKTGIKIC